MTLWIGHSIWLIGFVALSFCSCETNSEGVQSKTPNWEVGDAKAKYSFFVAGHTYGNAMNFQYGLHPPFAGSINEINQFPHLELGILTGDVVPKSEADYWDSALVDLKKFKVPYHIAPGNHDKSEEFDKRYEDYYSFMHYNDLFLILSPVNWVIEGEQLDFMKREIELNKAKTDHIFIFCHELIWWSPDNEFSDIEVNYRPHFPGKTNYWDEIQPFLDSLDQEVYLFAGDLGATDVVSSRSYVKQGKISYLASGMGGLKDDNMIFVSVLQNNSVKIQYVGKLDGEFGLLEEIVVQ